MIRISLHQIEIAAILSIITGCKAFYENAGMNVRLGSVTAPIELSEPTSSINLRALYSMDGIDFYAAKNCTVHMDYRNSYTNTYFCIVDRIGTQEGHIIVDPVGESSEANASISDINPINDLTNAH